MRDAILGQIRDMLADLLLLARSRSGETRLEETSLESNSLERKAKDPGQRTVAGTTWAAYSAAYRERYGVDPVRNGKVNSNITQLVARIGVDAPLVAAFYVRNDDPFYVKRCHPVGNLLADAEKLRTEWATKRQAPRILTIQEQSDRAAKQRADQAAERQKQETRSLIQKQQLLDRTQPDSAKERLAKLMAGIGG